MYHFFWCTLYYTQYVIIRWKRDVIISFSVVWTQERSANSDWFESSADNQRQSKTRFRIGFLLLGGIKRMLTQSSVGTIFKVKWKRPPFHGHWTHSLIPSRSQVVSTGLNPNLRKLFFGRWMDWRSIEHCLEVHCIAVLYFLVLKYRWSLQKSK